MLGANDMLYTEQNVAPAPYVGSTGGGTFDRIGATLSAAFEAIGARRQQNAIAAQAREQAATLRSEREAAARLGELILGVTNVDPRMLSQMQLDHAAGATMPEVGQPQDVTFDRLGAERGIVERRLGPTNIGEILAARVQAGGGEAAGGDIGDILANVSVSARDADSAAGFRGTPLSAGQSVFESGAREQAQLGRENQISLNDTDNETTRRGQDVSARSAREVAGIQASVDREQIEAQDRTTRAALETSRAARLDGQTLNAAIGGALGIRQDEILEGPPNMRALLVQRTSELLRANDALDPPTAAAMAVQELVQERGSRTSGGRRTRRFELIPQAATPPGQAVGSSIGDVLANVTRPQAQATQGPPQQVTPPPEMQGRPFRDDAGNIYDGQGRLVRPAE